VFSELIYFKKVKKIKVQAVCQMNWVEITYFILRRTDNRIASPDKANEKRDPFNSFTFSQTTMIVSVPNNAGKNFTQNSPPPS
jgi:hypothetical protein